MIEDFSFCRITSQHPSLQFRHWLIIFKDQIRDGVFQQKNLEPGISRIAPLRPITDLFPSRVEEDYRRDMTSAITARISFSQVTATGARDNTYTCVGHRCKNPAQNG